MKKLIKKMFCKFGWHSFKYDIVPYDTPLGKQASYRCKWCGYVGTLDFHGNLF